MTLTELRAEIYNITNRPDLVSLTTTAIKAATLKAHNTDFYSKDIYEMQFSFMAPAFTRSLDYISIVPNYRALKYMRIYDIASASTGEFFKVITPEEILDQFGRELTDVAYVAGRVIEIKSSTEFDTILLGAYVSPVITEAGYSSWVADLYPYAIVHEAARVIFGSISMQEEKNAQKELVAEQYAELKINAVTDVGY